MKQILYSLAIMLFVAISALAQTNIEAFGSSRDAKSSLNAIAHTSDWKYYITTLTLYGVNSGDNIDSLIHYFDYSDFDSSYFRNKEILLLITPVGNGQAVYWYYYPISASGSYVQRKIWAKDMLTQGWTSGATYPIYLGKDEFPGKGICICGINVGNGTITFDIEIWAGEGIGFGNNWIEFTQIDTIKSDTIEMVFPIINSSGSMSFWTNPDSISCATDSLTAELKPMLDYETESSYSWITLDSLTWLDWTDNLTYGHTILDYFMSCPFFKVRYYSGIVATGDTIKISTTVGGYRK